MAQFANQLEQWRLRRDGDPIEGTDTTVLPVRTPDGVAAVLKIAAAEESEPEHLVLRRWGGHGAVRLLSADPPHRAVLLERLRAESLLSLPDTDACAVVARLYDRLHVPAMPQLRTLPSMLTEWADEFRALPRSAPIPHRLVEQAGALSRDLAEQPADTVLHGNLHYANVLAAEREPWLAIAPRPVNGDPHYELAPMLWHRWDELTGNIRDGVRHRFFSLIDAAGLDEDAARAWVTVRVIREAVSALANAADLTRLVALAKAVQD